MKREDGQDGTGERTAGIVPSLIYKVLKYGNYADKDPSEALGEIMVSLGKEYSDAFGDWAANKIRINVTKLVKDEQSLFQDQRECRGGPK